MSDSSSAEEYERRKRKRNRSVSHSPHDSRKHKKHKKHKHRFSDSEEDDVRRDTRRDRNKGGHSRQHHDHYDPHKRIKQEPDDNQRQQRRDRERNDERRRKAREQRNRENKEENFQFGEGRHKGPGQAVKKEPKEKEKPNFEVSGKLTEDTNTYRGVVIKYNEPAEARKPRRRWRLYPFKGEQALPVLHIHRQSAYLLGRDRRVADIPVDHPSCSKQHAVLQFRLVEVNRDGRLGRQVKPYVIDLGSANGTYVNNKQIEAERYIELFEKDVLKFGYSTREYVLLHEKADTSELHDDNEDSSS